MRLEGSILPRLVNQNLLFFKLRLNGPMQIPAHSEVLFWSVVILNNYEIPTLKLIGEYGEPAKCRLRAPKFRMLMIRISLFFMNTFNVKNHIPKNIL